MDNEPASENECLTVVVLETINRGVNRSTKGSATPDCYDLPCPHASLPLSDYDVDYWSSSQMLSLVSSIIATVLTINDRLICPNITLFHSYTIPKISIEAYLSRIIRLAPFQSETFLIILMYLDRIGGGCKPMQILTNKFPRCLLHQALLSLEDVTQLDLVAALKLGCNQESQECCETANFETLGCFARTVHDMSEKFEKHTMDLGVGWESTADSTYSSSSRLPISRKLTINSYNIHRLLITSILVASKFSSDVFYSNTQYAMAGGLPLSELNNLELEFLFLSQFKLNTTELELLTYNTMLQNYCRRLFDTQKS